jgi:hypothetical protein
MSLHGAPMLAQSPLTRLRSTTNEAELNAMRAAAWHRHGVASIVVDDITDPWLPQPSCVILNLRQMAVMGAPCNKALKRQGVRPGVLANMLRAPLLAKIRTYSATQNRERRP